MFQQTHADMKDIKCNKRKLVIITFLLSKIVKPKIKNILHMKKHLTTPYTYQFVQEQINSSKIFTARKTFWSMDKTPPVSR